MRWPPMTGGGLLKHCFGSEHLYPVQPAKRSLQPHRHHQPGKIHGSIPAFVEKEGIDNGIIYSCVKKDVPFVLVGSIRDDGPLPEVYANVYEARMP